MMMMALDDLYGAYVEMVAETKPTEKAPPSIIRPSTRIASSHHHDYWYLTVTLAVLLGSVALALAIGQPLAAYFFGIRCFVPNNYLVWEATRPVTDCAYCRHVRRPLILPNMTREEFAVRMDGGRE